MNSWQFTLICALIAALLPVSASAKDALEDGGARVAIRQPPPGVQTKWLFYKPSQYVYLPEFQIHVFATPTVGADMLRQSAVAIQQMVAALKRPLDQQKFRGHQAFIITDADPDLSHSGGVPGQRNTGLKGVSLFNVSLICRSAVDTIRPAAPPKYRTWEVPAHEFGHAIEVTLGLQERSDEVFSRNASNYDPAVAREYFAWASEKWFDSRTDGQSRQAMPDWAYQYFASIFSADAPWTSKRNLNLCGPKEPANALR